LRTFFSGSGDALPCVNVQATEPVRTHVNGVNLSGFDTKKSTAFLSSVCARDWCFAQCVAAQCCPHLMLL
jgi:hypothetical protein